MLDKSKYVPFQDSEIKTIRKMEENILKMSYEGINKDMSSELFFEALEYVNDELNLPISPRSFEVILSQNGYAYANIIEFGIGDTETRSAISNAVANFYMHRPWPLNLEDGFPGVDEFEDRLLAEVKKRK
jgi:hypothetical protein